MNSLNFAAKLTSYAPPLNHHNPIPLSPLSLRFASPPPRSSIRASMQKPIPENSDKSPKFFKFQVTNQNSIPRISLTPLLAPLRTTLVTTIAAATLVFSGFCFSRKPAIAAPISPPPTVETDAVSDEEREKIIEEHLVSNPDDADALRSLMEIKIKSKKVPESIEILDKLIELEPEEVEWPMMKAHLYAYNGEIESAKIMFNELLKKDPFRVEAYHGLVTVASQEESSDELGIIEKRLEEVMRLCKKENKKSDLRDFKLLLAQIRVLEGSYDDALKFYQELVKEEPRDFRPYLCQGIIYTLLSKKSEAEKNFDKYRRLVPKGHPYASYFDENMMATKIFAQKMEMENERAMAKS